MVKAWDKYDPATMGVVVLNVRRSSLPDNVFDPGEKQKLPLKRPIQKGTEKTDKESPDMPNKRRKSSQHPSSNPTTGAVQTAPVKAMPNGNGLTVITPGSMTVTPSAVPDVPGKGGIKPPPALSTPVAAGVAGQ